MRLREDQVDMIRRCVLQLLGDQCSVRLFGSRLDDASKGGDVDLLLDVPNNIENPALWRPNYRYVYARFKWT